MNIVDIEILGRMYRLKTDENPEYVAELAFHVDTKLREIHDSFPTITSIRAAMLACIMITDELFKTRRNIDFFSQDIRGLGDKTEYLMHIFDDADSRQ